MSVPKLRFKEFSGDWSNQKYKDVLTIKYGKDHKLLKDGEIPVYGTGGVMRYADQYLYDGESILIGRKGTIDQPKYVNEKFWTVDTLFYSEIKQNISPLFVYQHALQVNWLGLNEATGVPSLNTNSINNVDIYLPSQTEQIKISSFLSAVDEKISLLTRKHELLIQYKHGMMQKLFSQKIRFKADDGSEFGEWVQTKLDDLIYLVSGFAFKSDFFSDKGKKLITPKNFTTYGKANFTALNTKWTSEVCDEKYICFPDDLLILLTDLTQSCELLGKPILLSDKDGVVLLNQRISKVIKKQEINKNFLLYLFLTDGFHELVVSTATGTTVKHSSNKIIESYKFRLPCLAEQAKIANCLSVIDQKIEVISQQIKQTKEWKKGLLQQMFV
ncbi:hypothetical protein SD67_00920 [Acinetobacter pittii]|uniref:restriction endonuclease subunit S n=1 Tax=Acinetobacter pittii TaxID=48296 RepID=UPI000584D4B4|nr:restriction endonuclease subunit S [Acinetobacter pittii]KIE87156.1 hypothetical protein SD67_00920 [Acinetobacter pittii]